MIYRPDRLLDTSWVKDLLSAKLGHPAVRHKSSKRTCPNVQTLRYWVPCECRYEKVSSPRKVRRWELSYKVIPEDESLSQLWYCMSELKLNYPGSTILTRLRLQKWEPYLHCIRRPFFITWFNNNIMHKILNTARLTAVFTQKSQYLVAILNKWSVRNEERDLIKISAISWISSRRTWYSSVTLWHIPVLFPIVAHPNSLIDLPVTIWCIARWLVITGSDFTRR